MRGFIKKKSRRFTDDVGRIATIIGPDIQFVGDLKSSENMRVESRVVGDGEVSGALIVGAQCVWKGNISADIVIVDGRVDGNINASKKLVLLPGARVSGDIKSPAIAMAEGAVCEGKVHMRNKAQPMSFTEQRAQN